MPAIPTNNIVTTDGDHTQAKARSRGRNLSIEISGTFGGASVTPGYLTSDTIPVFIADGAAKTATGRWTISSPSSGKVGVSVTSSTGTTAILVKITELLPR